MNEDFRPGIKRNTFTIRLEKEWFKNDIILQPPTVTFNLKEAEFYSNIETKKIIMFYPNPYCEYIISEKMFEELLNLVNNGKDN